VARETGGKRRERGLVRHAHYGRHNAVGGEEREERGKEVPFLCPEKGKKEKKKGKKSPSSSLRAQEKGKKNKRPVTREKGIALRIIEEKKDPGKGLRKGPASREGGGKKGSTFRSTTDKENQKRPAEEDRQAEGLRHKGKGGKTRGKEEGLLSFKRYALPIKEEKDLSSLRREKERDKDFRPSTSPDDIEREMSGEERGEKGCVL